MAVYRFNFIVSFHSTNLTGTRGLAVHEDCHRSVCQAGGAVALVADGIEIMGVVDDDFHGVYDTYDVLSIQR